MLNDFTAAERVYIACGYTDIRKGIDGLAALAQQQFQLDPCSKALFLFCERKRDRIKAFHLEDERLEISNNRAERNSKPFVIDRKNFLFANTPGGAQGSAIIFSLIETAKDNGLDPYAYLLHVLKTAPQMDLKQDVQKLLTWNVSLKK